MNTFWQRVRNALGHWFSQYLFTKGRSDVRLSIYYCFPFHNISNSMHSPGTWRGPVMRVPIFVITVVINILSSFSSPLKDVSSSWHWRGMTISLLLGYDYYLSACKGVCGICLHLNFRRNMQTECRSWKMICRALMRSSPTVGPCIGMSKND